MQVQLARAAALHRFEQQRLAEKFAAGDELVDARDVHVHDAARAHIQVAHFAIAHLPFGQADGWAGSVDQRVGKFLEQAVVIWFAREGDGVAFGFGAIAPAVEHGENDGFRSFWIVIVMSRDRIPYRNKSREGHAPTDADESQFRQLKGKRSHSPRPALTP